MKNNLRFLFILFIGSGILNAQETKDSLLTIDRIYNTSEFKKDRQRPISWIENGDAFVTIERNEKEHDQRVKYISRSNEKSL